VSGLPPGPATPSDAVRRLDELTTTALAALDRDRTVVFLAVSPLEQHGPHLPVGVDFYAATHLAEALATRLVARRPGWTALLAPPLPLGAFTLEAPGTVSVRQRAVRAVVTDYGRSLARAGFRYVLVANGHAGPGHLVALEEAAERVSRRHGIRMASLSGYLAWAFLRGRLAARIEAELGRPLTAPERRAFAEDAHAGWWETSLMLLLHPQLVDPGYRDLPPARYSWPRRLRPNFATRDGGLGYVGHPALGDPAFARAALEALLAEALSLAERFLDHGLPRRERRSPFYLIPFLRTDFWPVTAGVLALSATAWLAARRPGRKGDPGT
jgi:creatinine amidohydrolase